MELPKFAGSLVPIPYPFRDTPDICTCDKIHPGTDRLRRRTAFRARLCKRCTARLVATANASAPCFWIGLPRILWFTVKVA